jgi:hypothetical protein
MQNTFHLAAFVTCRNSTWQSGKYGLYTTKFCETGASVLKLHICPTFNFDASPKQNEHISTETNTTEAYHNQFLTLVTVRLRSALKHRATFRIMNLNTPFVCATKLAVTAECQIKYTTCISEMRFSTISTAKQ